MKEGADLVNDAYQVGQVIDYLQEKINPETQQFNTIELVANLEYMFYKGQQSSQPPSFSRTQADTASTILAPLSLQCQCEGKRKVR